MTVNRKMGIYCSIICMCMIQALQYCVSPVLGDIQTHFTDVSETVIQMLVTLPSLPSMIMAMIAGWLVLKISKKKLLLIGCFVTGVAGVLPFVSGSFGMLIFSRAVYGIGLGIALVMNTSLIADFFEGSERVAAMGFQSAAIGASLIFVNAAGGFIGRIGYKYSCLLTALGFVAMLIIFACLPDTGKVKVAGENKLKISGAAIRISVFMLLETLFVTAYTANIAMHVTQNLTADTGISGTLSGIFSASQMIVGLLLGLIVKITKKNTLPAAMACAAVGGVIIVLWPSSMVMLGVGSIFCGLSQGIYVPQASVELTNAVPSAAVTMATAIFSCMMNFGQLISPAVLNGISRVVFGKVTTSGAFMAMAVLDIVTVCVMVVLRTRTEKKKEN